MITDMLQDAFFYGYSEMLLSLHGLLQEVSHWAEACPCHQHLLDKRASTLERAVAASCPLRGKRAPEIACGSLQNVVAQLSQMRMGALLAGQVSRLGLLPTSASVLDRIASDFEKAKYHLLAALENKASCWTCLPWLLIGVGHHNVAQSRAAADRSLQAFDKLEDDAKVHQHSVTLRLLGAGSPLRQRLQEYAEGGDLHASLIPWALAWRFHFCCWVHWMSDCGSRAAIQYLERASIHQT